MVDGDNDYYDDGECTLIGSFWTCGIRRFFNNSQILGREIFDDDEDEAANDKDAKKKLKEVKKRNKFAAGTRNITDMFLAQKKKKKSAGEP